jgi:hypothetical protein
MQQMLRVIAVSPHMVADDLAYQNGNRFRFAGRSPTAAKVDDPTNIDLRFPPMEREYPNDGNHRPYLLRALRKGTIAPCDEFTARAAGLKFVPPKRRTEEPTETAETSAKEGE